MGEGDGTGLRALIGGYYLGPHHKAASIRVRKGSRCLPLSASRAAHEELGVQAAKATHLLPAVCAALAPLPEAPMVDRLTHRDPGSAGYSGSRRHEVVVMDTGSEGLRQLSGEW